jgi:hypothetical protein
MFQNKNNNKYEKPWKCSNQPARACQGSKDFQKPLKILLTFSLEIKCSSSI